MSEQQSPKKQWDCQLWAMHQGLYGKCAERTLKKWIRIYTNIQENIKEKRKNTVYFT